MIRRTFFIVFTTVISLFTASCQKEGEIDPPFKNVKVSFFEEFTVSGPLLWLRFETIETFPCSNFTLKVNHSGMEGFTEIFITDIETPNTCTPAMGPALFELNTGISPHNRHRFKIWINDNPKEFDLVVSPALIVADYTYDPSDNLIFMYDTLNRVPSNVVWGIATYTPTEKNNAHWQDVYKSFYNAGIVNIGLPDGHYHYFTIANRIITIKEQSAYDHPFYFEFEKPLYLLGEAFHKTQGNQHQPEISISMFNTMGETFVKSSNNK